MAAAAAAAASTHLCVMIVHREQLVCVLQGQTAVSTAPFVFLIEYGKE